MSGDLLLPGQANNRSSQDKSTRPSLERNAATDSRPVTSSRPTVQPTSNAITRPRGPTQSFRKLVFADPVAFLYLEEDPGTIVIDRRRRLEGYEIFVVEQWTCSRTHPTFLITTYTGDPSHSILVSVLGVPKDETAWSPRLKLYFQAISQYHAKEKETPMGLLMVTNLSGFPSALTVIPVPDGDIRKHRDDFIVNENLKRLNCSGRAAINLQPPQASTVTKFHQLYRTSENVRIYQSVTELVKICQTALVLYDKLEPTYVDGLLCDITEKALTDWWTEIGSFFYNLDPSDGILGPTTVAAILGLLIGAYHRLKAFGAPVGKDILDLVSMKRAIAHFQKATKMERSRRLDRETLSRLHRATAKTASGEGWKVPKAVKSTVADLSGKGGEMVMGIVGSRDKVGISEAETLDIDRLAQLVAGPKMKWLWQGKQIKSAELASPATDDLENRVFSTDDAGGFIWTSKRKGSHEPPLERSETLSSQQVSEGGRSGFGRIRDAVSLKTHGQRLKDGEDHYDQDDTPGTPTKRNSFRDQLMPAESSTNILPAFDTALMKASPEAGRSHSNTLKPVRSSVESEYQPSSHRDQLKRAPTEESPRKKQIKAEMADIRDKFKSENYQNFSNRFQYDGPRSKVLKRSRSNVQLLEQMEDLPRQNRLNRTLSFSLVENNILGYRDTFEEDSSQWDAVSGLRASMAVREAAVVAVEKRSRKILRLQQATIPFVQSRVSFVEHLDHDAQQQLEELNSLYYQKLEEYQVLRATSSDVVSHEKSTISESLRRVEMQGNKLDYELNALQSRMQEVEDGVADFERNVQTLEVRVRELAGHEEHTSVPWLARFLNFFSSNKEESSWLFG